MVIGFARAVLDHPPHLPPRLPLTPCHHRCWFRRVVSYRILFGRRLALGQEPSTCRRRHFACAPVRRGRDRGSCRLVRAGIPRQQVQKLLGHASIRTTQRYASLGDSQWALVRLVLR
ncbi:tyrosine-type recombinase/integrase [Nocardia sp. NPDC059764]|uniref:tyrosine-type recombinase/integrase n=1 Tax=Nocardia sp. NPDC059764 TaxID=3346939 RepID=UPI00365BA298